MNCSACGHPLASDLHAVRCEETSSLVVMLRAQLHTAKRGALGEQKRANKLEVLLREAAGVGSRSLLAYQARVVDLEKRLERSDEVRRKAVTAAEESERDRVLDTLFPDRPEIREKARERLGVPSLPHDDEAARAHRKLDEAISALRYLFKRGAPALELMQKAGFADWILALHAKIQARVSEKPRTRRPSTVDYEGAL